MNLNNKFYNYNMKNNNYNMKINNIKIEWKVKNCKILIFKIIKIKLFNLNKK